jgi:hypothetical protein
LEFSEKLGRRLNLVGRRNSLLVRNLSSLVQAEDIVSSEHLTTLLVVVSKFQQKDWMAKYERLSTFVVSVVAIVMQQEICYYCCCCTNPIRHEIKITG